MGLVVLVRLEQHLLVGQRRLPTERLVSALQTGIRYARHNQHLRATLLRAVGFFLFASAYWALLPLVARDRIAGGPKLYGILLGVIGASAIAGAFALPEFAGAEPYQFLRWAAAVCAVVSFLAIIRTWLRMGDDWRMDVGSRKTPLITDGLFRFIRHPIYTFSMLLVVCSALVVPTAPMSLP